MYQRILVPVDGSPTSNAELAEAIKLAKLIGARMRVMHHSTATGSTRARLEPR